MALTFIRKKENFTCGHCGARVRGNGYTNHCPKCLWSKHVDDSPGDRKNNCGGMMMPVDYNLEKNIYTLTYLCEKCGATKRNKAAAEDNFEEILKLAERVAKKKSF